jgi:hypothetical protein
MPPACSSVLIWYFKNNMAIVLIFAKHNCGKVFTLLDIPIADSISKD